METSPVEMMATRSTRHQYHYHYHPNHHISISCSLFLLPLLLLITISPTTTSSSSPIKSPSLVLDCNVNKPAHQPKKLVSTPSLFIFGDSFLDAGNNNYLTTTTLDQANFWPYGETHFGFPSGRFSDGRLMSDFIAEFANLPIVPPYLQPGTDQYHMLGVNFASGGAGTLVETFTGDVIDLKTQLGYYKEVENRLRKKLGNDEAEARISSAVFMFSIGSNDYLSQFLSNSSDLLGSYTFSEYVGMVIGNFSQVIKEIYDAGGRKFSIINLPPLGCIPITRLLNPENDGGCLDQVSQLVLLHNKALSDLLFHLEKQLKRFRYSLFDMHANVEDRIRNPAKYGFKQGKSACCGAGKFRGVYSCGGKRPVKEFELCPSPNDYVFWDSIHFTENAYRQLADQMWNGPYNLKDLFQLEA